MAWNRVTGASNSATGAEAAGYPVRNPSEFAERLGHSFAQPELLTRALGWSV